MIRRLIYGLVIVAVALVAGGPLRAQEVTIDPAFARTYWRFQGPQVLGAINSSLLLVDGYPAQYFEKGRLEDHRAAVSDPRWQVMYGRLTVELIALAPYMSISGTDLTYGGLLSLMSPQPAPQGHQGGPLPVDGGIFVPATPDLSSAPGFVVPKIFWDYLARPAVFPGGWLHAAGLPLTGAVTVVAQHPDGPRPVVLQAFERTILTYDPSNPPDWQVQRANLGTDRLWAEGIPPLLVSPSPLAGPKYIEISLREQHLYAYQGDILIMDAPVSTGKDGFNTPIGKFTIYSKLRLRTMRGEARGERWEVPNVPNVMYFYRDVALHGTYWHNRFGTGARLSHGCVNLPLDAAEQLYAWAPVGTSVEVKP